jgi:hypothetical protein
MLSKFFTKSAIALALIAGALLVNTAPAKAQGSGTIALSSIVGFVCSITVTATAGATSLVLTGSSSTQVEVGEVVQNCNDTAGYRLTVTSGHCGDAPLGAKLEGPAYLSSNANTYEMYYVAFTNPGTGGSTNTTNLLTAACSSQIARDVTTPIGGAITDEHSQVYITYTGNPSLVSGTYSDVLTITMSTK